MKLKRMMMAAVMTFAATLSLMADTETIGGYTWTYRINDDTAEIYNGDYSAAISPKPTGPLTIPSTFGGKPVASIGSGAFYGCDGLTSVTIPNSVTSIGKNAFYNCGGLTTVTIPQCVCSRSLSSIFPSSYRSIRSIVIMDGVASIEDRAFSGCTGLTNVTIPDSVTSIGVCAFSDCIGLPSVTIPDSVTNIGDSAFSDCSGLVSVTIPDGVMSIGEYAFSGCSGLASVTIPDGVTSVGYRAFDGCSESLYDTNSIHGVKLVDRWAIGNVGGLSGNLDLTGVRGIADGVFEYCDGLTSVTLGDGVASIGAGAFYGCSGLTSVTIPDSVMAIGRQAFYGCIGLSDTNGLIIVGDILFGYSGEGGDVIIPTNVTSIGEWAFYGCSGLANVTIPAAVTSIGDWAFYGCSGLTSMTIPDNVTSIGNSAFSYCSGLMSLTLPDNLIRINDYVFEGCSWLASVTIPDGVTSIGEYAFAWCEGLTNVTIPDSVRYIGNFAFLDCSGFANVTIPDGVTSIGDDAFAGCSGLTSVTIPESVTNIGNSAFYECSGLTSVTIPGSVTNINSAFYGCSGLLSFDVNESNPFYSSNNGLLLTKDGKTLIHGINGDVTIPNSVTSIGASAFSGCSGLTSLTIPNSVTNIGSSVFSGCSGLTSLTIPNSVTSIGDDAFSSCSRLTNMTIPDSVTSIGHGAFYNCSGLTSVTIPNSVTSIGSSAFSSCSGLTSVTIPGSVTNIGASAFSSCSGLTSVTLPDSVTSIGSSAFSGCSGLTSVTLPDSVTSIGRYAFSGCSGLTSVTLPDSVTSIGSSAFSYCSGLTNVHITDLAAWCRISFGSYDANPFCYAHNLYLNGSLVTDLIIPASVTSIGNYAFSNCSGLTSVTLPDSVTSIGVSAFSYCSGLTSVMIPQCVCSSGLSTVFPSSYQTITNVVISDSVTSIGASVFSGCGGLTSVTIPDSVTSIGRNAFFGCSGLTSVTLPDSVTSIASSAFSGCNGLRSITLMGDVFSGYANIPWKTLDMVYYSLAYTENWMPVFASCGIEEFVPFELINFTIQEEVVNGNTWRYYLNDGGAVVCSGEWKPAVADAGNGEVLTVPLSLGGCPVVEIGFAAFVGLNHINTVAIPEIVTNIADYAFYECNGLRQISIPSAVKSIGNFAFTYCDKLEVVTFKEPSLLTHIGDAAFRGCYNMKEDGFVLPSTVLEIGKDALQFTLPKVLSGTINENVRLKDGAVYVVSNNVTVASGATLTIPAGAILKFNKGCQLTVNGTLDAQGTRAAPIVFTSLKDDEHGGDTNGDGDKTQPSGGDWNGIWVYGKADIAYAEMMYSGNGNERGIIQTSGSGALTMAGCTVAHALNDGIWNWGGTICVTNTVFVDTGWATAPYQGSRNEFVNCVFYGNDVGMCYWSHWNGKPVYKNCIFANCGHGWCELGSGSYGAPPSGVSVVSCLFWNPVGFGAQSCGIVGSNGNIWGDPMFVDAENGDFRIQKGSTCVNAGDASVAPEYDYYGQPRDDGAPDIGIYEMTSGMSVNDLAAVAVNAQAARSTIGETLTISYEVSNVGKQAINGSWRDKVSLVSADGGYSIDLGTAVQTAILADGTEKTLDASFTVPPEAEGTWRVQVGVNVERDIYEGTNVMNNVATSAGTVEISLPARAAADGFSGTAKKGAPASAKFALDGTEPMVARINAPAGTVVYLGSGFMPSASSYSARAVVGADGGLIGIPAGVTTAYLLVETTSASGAAFSMTLESAALAVQSVSPATLPYTGTTGLVIDGANFAEGCTVVVERAASAFGTGEPPVLQVAATVVSPTRLTAQIDCSRLTAGATYDVKVVGADEASAVLPNAVTVAKVPAAPKLKATLDAPASVRRGRTLTVYIDYENVGNADLPAPIFELISEGQVFKIDGACYTNSVKVMGLSAEAPVGTLRPGEPQRLGIPVTILAENVKWKLKSYHAAQVGAKTAKFSLRELYDDDWVLYHVSDDDATIANLRTGIGSTFADYYTSLGGWLGTIEPQTMDYEALKSTFGRYQYLKAAGMLDKGAEDSSTGGSPVQNMNASAARSTSATGGAVLLGVDEQTRGCNHVVMANEWKLAGNGTIFKLCPRCKEWHQLVCGYNAIGSQDWKDWYSILETDSFIASRHTYVICHGNYNSVNTPWIKEMGKKILKRYEDNNLAEPMILAVNWGEGANRSLWSGVVPPFAFRSAAAIPETAYEAIRQLAKINLMPDNTVLIGHSHGGHVAAHIACNFNLYGEGGKFKRLVGLDTSTTDNGIHNFWKEAKKVTGFNLITPLANSKWYGDWTPEKWISKVRDRCIQVEFYKSSWDMSLEKSTELFGHYNFVVAKESDFYEHKVLGFVREFDRHSYAYEWFSETITDADRYANLGFNFDKDHSWEKLCKEKVIPSGGEKDFTGVIRDGCVEMTYGCSIDTWRYAETVLNHDDWKSSKPMRKMANSLTRTVEYKVWPFLPSRLVNGDNLIVRDFNSADNQSIPYYLGGMMLNGWSGKSPLPWGNNIATCAWLIDLSGLIDQDRTKGELVDDLLARVGDATAINITQEQLLSIVGTSDKFIRRIGMCRIGDPSVKPESSATIFKEPGRPSDNTSVFVHIKNNCFDSDRLIGAKDETGVFHQQRRILLLVGSGVEQTYFDPHDKMPNVYQWDADLSNNYALREVEVLPTEVHAIISESKAVEKSTAARSVRLLAAAPTHQLSANALKPGEVVQVKADKNGNWSIDLDASESYTTDDEEDITVNRFELIDTVGKKGTVAMRKTDFGSGTDYQQIDFPWVTVHGQLPMTTDVDGNPVCEGERYVVQLTVFATGEEEDVTTCVLDVRATEEEDPGEEEDAGGSNEPKSCDPNEMVGDEGVGEARYVKPGQELTYTIYFENKSDAEAAAACVEVFNPLNEWLDWSSLTMLDVGYNNNVDNGLSGLHEGESEKTMDGTNVSVRTEFKVVYYDEEGNVVEGDDGDGGRGATALPDGVAYAQAEWYLRIIDPNGDSEGWPLDMTGGFLPPNDDTHCGEGYIRYKIRVRDDAPGNIVITNSATIIFDHFNDPIKTDPAWWNTVSPEEESLQAGDYFKMTLAELGYDVPTNGTPYEVKALGLPAGLKLKYNAAVTKKVKGKTVVVKKAKTEWWIEGVPTAPLDFMTNPPYLVITANGATRTETLPLEVNAQEVKDLGELALGETVNTNGWLAGVGKGWTVTGLPTGLKFATKKVTKTTGSGKKKVTTTIAEAYAVYGKTTKAGLFTITAKKKKGAFYETMKYRVLVRPKAVDTALFGESFTNITTMAYVPLNWNLESGEAVPSVPSVPFVPSAVSGKVAKVAGLPTGLTFAAANTYSDKKKTKLKQAAQTISGTPTKPGTYAVTFTKNVKSGKKTVAKTAQILWIVVENDAELELGFNIDGGVIESGTVGLEYGDLLAFSATEGAKVTASGLPAGITLANLGGGKYSFTGFTTKAGTYLVTVKATMNGKSVTQRLALKVEGLPTWAKGTYNGYVTGADGATNGLATVTVSAVGKISGKFYEGGTNWTLTAASYTAATSAAAPAEGDPAATSAAAPAEGDPAATSAAAPADFTCSNVVARYAYKVTETVRGKKKKVTKYVERTFTLTVAPGEFGGVATLTEIGVAGDPPATATTLTAWQNLWGSTYKSLGKKLFSSKSGKKTLAYKTFTIKGGTDVGMEIGLRETDTLTLKITTAGAVTATLTYDTGKTTKDKKTKKTVKVYYKPTCSTVVIPTSAPDDETFTGHVPLFMPPATNGFPGFIVDVAYPFEAHNVPGPDGGGN